MEVEMKSIAKVICCGVALAWMCSAAAKDADATQAAEAEVTEVTPAADGVEVSALPAGGNSALTQVAAEAAAPASAGATANTVLADAGAPAPAAAEDAKVVPTPPAPRIAVKPYHDKINRARVEKRIENNAAITKKRSAVVEKDAADRAAKAQQGQ
jgi:hypothetical protein